MKRLLVFLAAALIASVLMTIPVASANDTENTNNATHVNIGDYFPEDLLTLLSAEEIDVLQHKLDVSYGTDLFEDTVSAIKEWLTDRSQEREKFKERLEKKQEILEWPQEKIEKYKEKFDEKFEKKIDKGFGRLMEKKFYCMKYPDCGPAEIKKPELRRKEMPSTARISMPNSVITYVKGVGDVEEVGNGILHVVKRGVIEKLVVSASTALVSVNESGVATNITLDAFQSGDRIMAMVRMNERFPHAPDAIAIVRIMQQTAEVE